MVFACSTGPGERRDERGIHPVREDVTAIVKRLGIPEGPDLRPRYFAAGEFVVVTVTKRRMNLGAAYEEAQRLLDRSINPDLGNLADAYTKELGDLIGAMREAMGNRPTPPASIAKAA